MYTNKLMYDDTYIKCSVDKLCQSNEKSPYVYIRRCTKLIQPRLCVFMDKMMVDKVFGG